MVSTRSSSLRLSSPPQTKTTTTTTTTTKPMPAMPSAPRSASSRAPSPTAWSHAPSRLALLWLAVSLPLVVWDTLYILLRPRTMPGGALHWPLWVPYALYGEVDHVYGWVAFHARDGFTAAQGSLNAVETGMYLFYLWEVLRGSSLRVGVKDGARRVGGRVGGRAVLVGFSAAVMTLSKTVLYWANEYYSGFRHVGHNTASDLILLWIIPNSPWLVFPCFMIWEMGQDILDGIEGASARDKEE